MASSGVLIVVRAASGHGVKAAIVALAPGTVAVGLAT